MEQVSRRRFFGLLGGVTAAIVAKPIFILPPMQGWNALGSGIYTPSVYLTTDWVTRKTLEILQKHLVFTEAFNREWDGSLRRNNSLIRVPLAYEVQ